MADWVIRFHGEPIAMRSGVDEALLHAAKIADDAAKCAHAMGNKARARSYSSMALGFLGAADSPDDAPAKRDGLCFASYNQTDDKKDTSMSVTVRD